MRTALFNLLALTCLSLAIAAAAPGCEEQTDPSLVPPDVDAPATAPATTRTSVALAPQITPPSASGLPADLALNARTPAEHRKAAEAGDIGSMLLLGRSHESLGQRAEARKWYQRAAAAGNEEGKQALANLDAPATRPLASTATAPSDGDVASAPGAGGNGPTTRRVPVAPLPPGEPGKLRWIDLGAILNYEDMIEKAQVIPVNPTRAVYPNQKTQFVGVTSSRDAGITVAAMGPSEGELNEVTAVIRVRNKVDPGSSPRVAQAGAVAARVTSDNVNQREFLEWVTNYLRNEQRSEPIFRNGWRITISGYAAENHRDPKPHLGTAIMIEMKK